MKNYLIILKRKGDYYSNEFEKIYLPTSTCEIMKAVDKLGCDYMLDDYDIAYVDFGYPVINQYAYDSNIAVLNHLAHLLQSYTGTSGTLCAELIFSECKCVYDIISHLENRPELVVFERMKNIYDAGEVWFKMDYYQKGLCQYVPYEEYIYDLEHLDDGTLERWYIDCAMEKLKFKKYKFTEYGLVYEEKLIQLPF